MSPPKKDATRVPRGAHALTVTCGDRFDGEAGANGIGAGWGAGGTSVANVYVKSGTGSDLFPAASRAVAPKSHTPADGNATRTLQAPAGPAVATNSSPSCASVTVAPISAIPSMSGASSAE